MKQIVTNTHDEGAEISGSLFKVMAQRPVMPKRTIKWNFKQKSEEFNIECEYDNELLLVDKFKETTEEKTIQVNPQCCFLKCVNISVI